MGKATMFFGFIWMITCIAGSILQGGVAFATTTLTAPISETDTVIPVESTAGFVVPGRIVIDGEEIAYSAVTPTAFTGTLAQPLLRGVNGTQAAAHSHRNADGTPKVVRTVEGSLLNNSIDYNLTVLRNSTGARMIIDVPVALFNTLMAFGTAPFAFLGTDLQLLTVVWGIMFLGFVVSLLYGFFGR